MSLGTLIRGDDWKFTFTVLDPQGTPLNIIGGAIWLTFKATTDVGSVPDSGAAFQVSDIDIQDADDPDNNVGQGIVVLRARHNSAGVSPPNNTLVAAGKYSYDVQYQAAGAGGAITTIETGSVTVATQVTDSFQS